MKRVFILILFLFAATSYCMEYFSFDGQKPKILVQDALAEPFIPPSKKTIKAALQRIRAFQLKDQVYGPALAFLKLLPRQKVQSVALSTEKKLGEESLPIYSVMSTSMAIKLFKDDPLRAEVFYQPADVDYVEGADLFSISKISALKIAEIIYPDIYGEEFSQRYKNVHTEGIRVFDVTVRRDDLNTRLLSNNGFAFKLLPHFDVNRANNDYLRPFDATMVVAMEAHGFGKQTMQIGLTPRTNLEKGAVIDEDRVFMVREIEIKNGMGYLIMQRQLEEDEWVIVHTASPIHAENVTPCAMRCMMVINSCLHENTEFIREHRKLEPLTDQN
jgi:hypothetical protein